MTATQFLLGAVRLALILVPLLSLAHRLRRRLVPDAHRALGVLAECVMAVSLLTVGAELLGLAGLLGAFALGALFAAGWVAAHLSLGADRTRAPRPGRTASHATSVTTVCATVAALIVVAPQWLLGTANSLGSGMLNFDTLWYHMPFAAGFAQTGSVTGIHFTQADPITAYYPANSELVPRGRHHRSARRLPLAADEPPVARDRAARGVVSRTALARRAPDTRCRVPGVRPAGPERDSAR